MPTAQEHYAQHLAPIYLWMAGGLDAALNTGTADVAPFIKEGGIAFDLGAGFGMHAIPLARAGYAVTAVDSSAVLLKVLNDHSAGLTVRAVEADLLEFTKAVREPAQLIVCMGDTLTHLRSMSDVSRLCRQVAAALAPGGTFVTTFRDYTSAASGERRFIAVRADADRILTCFLEEFGDQILVHDLLHERDGERWTFKVSSYPKLRLAPCAVLANLEQHGLHARIEPAPRGMVRIVASASD